MIPVENFRKIKHSFTDHQSVTGENHSDELPITLTFTSMGYLEQPVYLMHVFTVGEKLEQPEEAHIDTSC